MSDGGLDQPFNPFGLAGQAASGQSGKQLFDVILPSGSTLKVPTEEERDYLTRAVDRYAEDYEFTNASDVGELDRCLGIELQMHRAQVWLAQLQDYTGKTLSATDANALMQRVKELSGEIRQIKKGLVMDKVGRDRTSGKGSIFEYWSDVTERARRFMIFRNRQANRAIELANDLSTLMTCRRNAVTEKEKRMLRVHDQDIFDWIEQVFIPEFEAVDAEYRASDQSMWILKTA